MLLLFESSRSVRGLLTEGPGHGRAGGAKHDKVFMATLRPLPWNETYLSAVPTPGMSRDHSPSASALMRFVGLTRDCAHSISSQDTSSNLPLFPGRP